MQSHSTVSRKRIHNPRTGKYYALRVRSSSKGRRGTIKGLWKPPKKEGGSQDVGEFPFYFYRNFDEPLGVSVQSIPDFKEQIQSLDAASLEFHVLRGDFETWLQCMGAHRLAQRLEKIKPEKGEALRDQLLAALN